MDDPVSYSYNISLVERQKGFSISHLYTQLGPFDSKLMIYVALLLGEEILSQLRGKRVNLQMHTQLQFHHFAFKLMIFTVILQEDKIRYTLFQTKCP